MPACSCLPKSKLKTTDFVDIMISDSSRDLHSSRNRPLKSADDRYFYNFEKKVKMLVCLKWS